MAIITVRQSRRGPLASYVQAVRKGMAGRGMGQDNEFGDFPTFTPSLPTTTDLTGGLSQLMGSIDTSFFGGSTPSTGSPATASNPSGNGFNLSALLNSLTSSAGSAAKIYNSLQTPSLIPGTNAIYNAATGQYYNPTTGQVVNPSGVSTLGIPTDLSAMMPQILLYGGLALGAILLVSAVGKH